MVSIRSRLVAFFSAALLAVTPALLPQALADSPKAGQLAPDFRLQDQNGKWVSLREQRGKWVVLYFYPKDNTPGCTTQACEFRDDIFSFRKANVVILGVTSLQGRHYPRGEAPIDCSGDPAKERQLMTDYIKAMEITWPIAYSTQDVFNPDYDVNGIPHVAIIDAKGVLRHNNLHPASPIEEKTKLIDALLVEAGKTPPPAPVAKDAP